MGLTGLGIFPILFRYWLTNVDNLYLVTFSVLLFNQHALRNINLVSYLLEGFANCTPIQGQKIRNTTPPALIV
jgi:hypothetical protein